MQSLVFWRPFRGSKEIFAHGLTVSDCIGGIQLPALTHAVSQSGLWVEKIECRVNVKGGLVILDARCLVSNMPVLGIAKERQAISRHPVDFYESVEVALV